MKVFEVPMVAASLVGLGCLAGLAAPRARGDFTFGQPVAVDATEQYFPNVDVYVSSFSSDNLEMFVYVRPEAGGQGGDDIWVLKRASAQEPWGPPENLGPLVNSTKRDASALISGDGLELYFYSSRSGGYGNSDCYVTRRATRTSPWGPPTNLGPKVNSPYPDVGCSVSSDGLELYFGSDRPGGYGLSDLYVSTRATTQDPWGDPVNLGPAVNVTGPFYTQSPYLSPDGLLLLFQVCPAAMLADKSDLWMARRAGRSAPWEPAVKLPPIILGPNQNCSPCLAPDGSTLYFAWNQFIGRNKRWQAPILPIVDFNGDGKVDLVDLVMLIDNWGSNKTLYDIGPYAWGDGKVDIEDLKVFMTYYEKENPPAQP